MTDEILLVAFAADPYVSSDGMAGWGFLRAALDSPEIGKVHLISNERSILSCKNAIPFIDSDKIVYHSVGNSKFFLKYGNVPFGIIARLCYVDWIYQARRYLKSDNFDFSKIEIVHHVTLATEIYPTIFRAVPSQCRKIIGPVGSSGNFKIFLAKPRSRFTFKEFVKQILRNYVSKYRLKQIANQVDLFIGNNLFATNQVADLEKCESIYFPNQIVPSEKKATSISSHKVMDVLIVGQIIPGKRPDLAIDFLSRNEFNSLSIGILGEGQGGFKKHLKTLIADRNLIHRVNFLGNLPREVVLSTMQNAQFLIHFSGREGASYVVGEAINMGLPVLILNGTGAADTLTLFPGYGISLNVEDLNKIEPSKILQELRSIRVTPSNHWTFGRITRFLEEIYSVRSDRNRKQK
jgi:glycosyltransferase involved in cell wall biosynthesis